MFNTLRNKIVFLACCVTLVTSVLIGSLTYIRIVQISTDTAIESLANETRIMTLRFKDAYDRMRNDGSIVARTEPARGIIRSLDNGDIDPKDGSTTKLWRNRLETIFTSVMKGRPHYTQIRYIGLDDDGREQVRVNRTESGFERVPVDELQQKAQEPYFQRGKELKPGQFHFSEVTYNREHGSVTQDKVPTMRLVLPVHKDNGEMFGMLVINADYEALLHEQFGIIRPDKKMFIVNNRGDYITYTPEEGVSNLELHNNYTKTPPSTVTLINSADEDEEIIEEADDLSYFVRLRIDPDNPEAFLGVVLKVPKDKLLQSAYETERDTLIISAILVIVTLTGTYVLASWFTRPLQTMTREVADAVKNKSTDINLPVDRNDEVGALARAFASLTQALMKSEAKARGVFENANDGIITIDQTGKIEVFNPSSEKIFGYKAEEVFGKNIKMLMPNPYHEEHDQYLLNYLKTGIKKIMGVEREVRGKRKDGSVFPLEISVSEVALENDLMFTGIVRDITERKNAENERERLIRELEISNQELDDFAYVASHDLKAPLRVIDNASKWLEEDLEKHLDEDTRESMDLLRNRVSRMEKLLDDLLEYSRIGRATDDRFKEQVKGDVLMTNIIGLLSPPENFKISVDTAMKSVIVNRMPLQQILLNLISNAIKHHDKDKGLIEVSVEEQGDEYSFAVKDDGPGIPAEFQEKVFKMFQTLKPRDQVEGSGMGLAMVHKNIKLCGGDITLESTEGQGCTFRFSWPKQQQFH